MFFDELTPVAQEMLRQPVAFLGGFVAGALRLNLNDDPVKSWLEQQNINVASQSDYANDAESNGGPQKITID